MSACDFTPTYPAGPRDPNAPTSPRAAAIKFVHIQGGFGRLWRTFLATVLLSVLTFTVYRFWGLTKIRRLLWSRVTLLDDPLEYTGNGWELFIGFVKVMFLFVLPVALVITGLNFAFQSMGLFTLEQIMGFLTAVGFYWIFEVAVFLRFRYRANRTSWRGIRARVSGSATHFAGWSLLLAVGVALTGGILYPFAHAFFMRYKLNCLSFGGQRVNSTFSSSTTYGRFFLCFTLGSIFSAVVVYSLIYLIGFVTLFNFADQGTPPMPLGATSLLPQLLGFLMIPIVFLPLAWYWAKFYREAAKSVWIGEQRIEVSYDVTGWRLVRYVLGNWLIMIFSLGLLWPLTWTRKIDLIRECLTIDNEIPIEAMMQEAYDPTHVGEELGGGFDIV